MEQRHNNLELAKYKMLPSSIIDNGQRFLGNVINVPTSPNYYSGTNNALNNIVNSWVRSSRF